MTQPNNINSARSQASPDPSLDENVGHYPTPEWQKFGAHQWHDSDLSDQLHQAMIDIGDGIELCVEAGGNPNHPPLLMVMGLGSQMIFWPENFIKRLIDAGFFVIRFDNRDIGLSSKVQIDGLPRISQLKMMMRLQTGLSNKSAQVAYNLTDMAEDTARLIKALQLGKTHLLGASMGGMIAQIVAARYPSLVQRMALMFTTTNRAFLRPPKPRQLYTLINRPESHSERDIVRHSVWFMKTVGTPGHVNVRMVREIAKIRYQRSFHPLGTVQQLNAILASGSISRYSKQVKAPTIVLHGSADGLLPASQGRVVAKTIPNAKFYLIEGMAHDIPEYYQPYMVDLISSHLLAHRS
ncbi:MULTISPECIES: alpha/beta fold hydrolase [unclassified Psychrobacter]|uniref:alpha/beta fold hydrolase n=1 Tax=unclassified Psychrobacter TaxID=196806 RepID=UPI0009470CCF|nr:MULTISPECIES: alpha/beta hydrolase [unclassified Psychrobacter]MDN5732938.1 alpha/beta fold hydrolase [Psychrobacter sp.]OLF40016.1 alpha/beta hydrolase [Psychrobacter sp. Rd 27.2]PJX24192.1 alpha/beta hydrolase [Psychrobacter sp. L7]